MKIRLTANAGVMLSFHDIHIWIDALHHNGDAGFSEVTPELWEEILKLAEIEPPHMLLYTHTHNDHFSADLTEKLQKRFPDVGVFCPETLPGNSICVQGERLAFRVGEVEILFKKVPHEGKQFTDVRNYLVCVSDKEGAYVFTSDTAIAAEEVADLAKEKDIRAVFLDFPWFTLKRGRQFMKEHLSDVQKVLYHVPFPKDDAFGYRAYIEKASKTDPEMQDVLLLWEPLQEMNL